MSASPEQDRIGSQAVDWLQQLIALPSVSDQSNKSITRWIADRLAELGFNCELTSYADRAGVAKFNLIGHRPPTRPSNVAGRDESHPGVAYLCHTDVVPAIGWTGPGGDPFAAVTTDDRIFGRGACDMKGSLATMLAAVAGWEPDEQQASLWIVCTADEETGFDGARHLVAQSQRYQEMVAAQPFAIIGEPTHLKPIHAHKGITGFRLTSRGRAAHSSTAVGVNATLAMVPILSLMADIEQRTREHRGYQDPSFNPPFLSWNFGVEGSTSAVNVTPERCDAWCSLRPMPGIDGQDLIDAVRAAAERHGVEFETIDGCEPMWVDPSDRWVRSISEVTGHPPITASYGTDGGIFTQLRHRVVIGPGHIRQAHTTDEWIAIGQLHAGVELFTRLLRMHG